MAKIQKRVATGCLLLCCALLFFACEKAPSPTADKETPSETTLEVNATVHGTEAPPPLQTRPEPPAVDSEAWNKAFRDRMDQLREEFPDGSFWNHAEKADNWLGVTDIPCDHYVYGRRDCNLYDCASTRACGWSYGTQCAGFAGLLSDRVFGENAPVHVFYDYDALLPGDQARINDNHHTVFILSKTDESVVVVECNAGGMNDCKIAWGRVIPRAELKGFYLTRRDSDAK